MILNKKICYIYKYIFLFNINMEDNFRKLEDICNIVKVHSFNINILDNGMYPVINAGQNQVGFYNEYNINEHIIVCSLVGNNAGFINKYGTKIYAKNCFTIVPKDIGINNIYLYHILKLYQEKIYNLRTGVVIQSIKKESLEDILIPVPSIQVQLEIVNKINDIDICISQLENVIKDKKEKITSILLDMVNELN